MQAAGNHEAQHHTMRPKAGPKLAISTTMQVSQPKHWPAL